MRPHNPGERGRTASTLELFFDLVFVVAVGNAASEAHHAITEAHVVNGLSSYLLVFFSIWWAWMNFTWFATAFDTDDWLYRVVTFVQMGGVLVLAAGIAPLFHDGDPTLLVFAYVVMRVAMVAQWLRASRRAGEWRRATLLYAGGITLVQILWLLMLLLPRGPIMTVTIIVLMGAEVLVPVIAERTGRHTPWHPHHITERYGLFTLIVLGENLLASSNAIIESLHSGKELPQLVSIAALALVATAALWWIYFWPPHHTAIESFSASIKYGYLHYFVFAAAGLISVGIETLIDRVEHRSELFEWQAALTIAVPVAVFLLVVWWVAMARHADAVVNTAVPVAAVAIVLSAWLPAAPVIMTLLLVALVVVLVVRPPRPEPRKVPA